MPSQQRVAPARGERQHEVRGKLAEIYTDQVLWQCTTCGACENQCPVGIEPDISHEEHNPLCGDRFTVYVRQ